MNRDSTVSVIIPTLGRSLLLVRAIESALSQTKPPAEIIIVLDGQNYTRELQKLVKSPLVRMLVLPDQKGHSEALNYGIRSSIGAWIALLDDDDEWMPNKLELQVKAASTSSYTYPIACSSVIVRTPNGQCIMPRRGPQPKQPVDEYLFCRRSLFPGEVFLQTSNLLIPRNLFDHVMFCRERHKWDDLDFLLRAGKIAGVGLEFLAEPLSFYETGDKSRQTMSSVYDWRFLFAWAQRNRRLFAKRAYSGILLTRIMHEAVRQRDRAAVRPIASEAFLCGAPDLIQIVSLAGCFSSLWAPREVYDWLITALRGTTAV